MKKTFKRLHDEKIDLSIYENVPLTDDEKKVIKKRIKNKLRRKKKSRKKLLFAASLAVLAFLAMNTHLFIFPDIPMIGSKIEEYIPCKGQPLKDYQSVIGQTVIDKGFAVIFNEVILDDERLIISSTFQPDQMNLNPLNLEDILFPLPKVCLNGKEMKVSESESIKITDSVYIYLAAISLENVDLEDEMNMKIVYQNLEVINPKPVQLGGKWRFSFSVSREELATKTKKMTINKILTLENGQKITVKELIITPASIKLNYKIEDGEYDVHFNIENQYGVQFFLKTAGILNEIRYNRFVAVAGILNEIKYNRFVAVYENTTKLKITPYITREAGEKGTSQVLYDKAFYVDIN